MAGESDWAHVQARLIRAYVAGNDPQVGREMIREMLWQAYEAGHAAGREVGRGFVWSGEVRSPTQVQPERTPDRWVVIHDAGHGECGAILDRDGRCPACGFCPGANSIDVVERPGWVDSSAGGGAVEVGAGG